MALDPTSKPGKNLTRSAETEQKGRCACSVSRRTALAPNLPDRTVAALSSRA